MNHKLALGTVQFGVPYGISNVSGQTDVEEVKKILALAQKNGISNIDTAAVYGNSELALGQAIAGFNRADFKIVTKSPHFNSNVITNHEVSLLRTTFGQSLKDLGLERVDGVLIHRCDDLFVEDGYKIFRELESLKAQGRVKKIGVSVYNSQQIARVLNEFSIDLIQLPVNILDQRLIEDGSLERLRERGVEIHARSVFLQGLLLMPVESISPWFNPILPRINRFHDLAKEMELSPLQLALGFVNALKQVDRVVVGVNNVNQLQEILEAANASVNVLQYQELSVQDSMFINPGNWQV